MAKGKGRAGKGIGIVIALALLIFGVTYSQYNADTSDWQSTNNSSPGGGNQITMSQYKVGIMVSFTATAVSGMGGSPPSGSPAILNPVVDVTKTWEKIDYLAYMGGKISNLFNGLSTTTSSSAPTINIKIYVIPMVSSPMTDTVYTIFDQTITASSLNIKTDWHFYGPSDVTKYTVRVVVTSVSQDPSQSYNGDIVGGNGLMLFTKDIIVEYNT